MTPSQVPSDTTPSAYRPGGFRAGPAVIATGAVHVGIAALLLALPAVEKVQEIIWAPTPTHNYPADPPPPEQAPPERTAPEVKSVTVDPRVDDLSAIRPDLGIATANEIDTDVVPLDLGGRDLFKDATNPPAPVITAAQLDKRFLRGFQPDYPPAMVRLGKEGAVTVRVTIAPDGRVIDVMLVRADDPAFFEATRKQALRHWRFLPARRDGVAISSEREMTVRFTLVE